MGVKPVKNDAGQLSLDEEANIMVMKMSCVIMQKVYLHLEIKIFMFTLSVTSQANVNIKLTWH